MRDGGGRGGADPMIPEGTNRQFSSFFRPGQVTKLRCGRRAHNGGATADLDSQGRDRLARQRRRVGRCYIGCTALVFHVASTTERTGARTHRLSKRKTERQRAEPESVFENGLLDMPQRASERASESESEFEVGRE